MGNWEIMVCCNKGRVQKFYRRSVGFYGDEREEGLFLFKDGFLEKRVGMKDLERCCNKI